MIRYYYNITNNNFSELKFHNDYIIKEYENIGKNKTRLLFEFDNIKPDFNIKYKIYSSLFLKESINELLTTSAILFNKPIDNEIILVNSSEDKFSFNMTINTTNVINYIFIIQLKIVIDYDESDYHRNKDYLIYTIEKDLTEYLKEEEKKDIRNEKTLTLLKIIISIIFIILIGVFVFIGIIYYNLKKKNKELKEKVLSISFSTGQSDEVLDRTSDNSKRDQEYETTFI